MDGKEPVKMKVEIEEPSAATIGIEVLVTLGIGVLTLGIFLYAIIMLFVF